MSYVNVLTNSYISAFTFVNYVQVITVLICYAIGYKLFKNNVCCIYKVELYINPILFLFRAKWCYFNHTLKYHCSFITLCNSYLT